MDVNGINKLAAENYHLLYNDVYQIKATALRLTNTIGPRMRIKDARQTFVGVWIRRLIEGRPIEVWGGEQLRDFTDVDDAVEAFLLAGASEQAAGKVYNLGGVDVIDLASLAKMMIDVNGGGEAVRYDFPADRKAIDIGDYYADFTKIRTELGWEPKKPVRDTIERTLAYYRKYLPKYL